MLKKIFDRQKEKAAMKAAYAGNFDQAFAVLETGGDINASYYVGDPDEGGGEGNIGYSAVMHGNVEALQKALDKGLNPDLQSPYRAPLVVFAIIHKQEDAARLLIERGADVATYRMYDFLSPLSLAKMLQMDGLAALIETKLTLAQLEDSRAADLPWDRPEQAPAPRKGFNP